MRAYAERLLLVQGSGIRAGIDALAGLVTAARHRFSEVELFVDGLEKVPVQPDPPGEVPERLWTG